MLTHVFLYSWTIGVGATWPNLGEIDILEGISVNPVNRYTLHSQAGLVVDGSAPETGTRGLTNCGIDAGTSGCYTDENMSGTYGDSFNAQGGGV
jgi:hypothetical protein